VKVLLVKTSSLGDVIHNLPVASDIRAAWPGAAIHWVVEESCAAVPRLHSAVARVLPVALRRWRRSFLSGDARAEMRVFARELKRETYDAVIDTQGLLKSALVTWLARGTRHGLDFASAREPLFPFYDCVHAVPWTMHAVERNRSLARLALGHALAPRVNYGITAGISAPATRAPWAPPGAYAVLVHVTSAASKLWAVERWAELGAQLEQRGTRSLLPWGSAAEQARAREIAGRIPGAVVAPALSLADAAAVLAGARGVVGVDTGLTHLACALGVPTVGIYCATDPAATGLYGGAHIANLGGKQAPPSAPDAMAELERLTAGTGR
jgi:heptosyltransferase-1